MKVQRALDLAKAIREEYNKDLPNFNILADLGKDLADFLLVEVEGTYNYTSLAECIASGEHLSDCDSDGYCNLCGHQEK